MQYHTKTNSKVLFYKVFRFIFCTVTVFSCLFSQAQTYFIKGKIIEKETEIETYGAYIELKDSLSYSLISTTSDSQGNYTFKNIPKGQYVINISLIGYKDLEIGQIQLFSDTILKTQAIEVSDFLLNSISINESALLDFEKKIYKTSEDLISTQNSVIDILQNIPSVNVDIDGKVSLRNSSDVTFFINGKPSAMMQRNAAVMLSQMPALMIEQIEIITNPSAKYRANGTAGIINIVTKESTEETFSGILNANVGTEKRYNGNAGILLDLGFLSVTLDYGLRNNAGGFIFKDIRNYKSKNQLVSNYTEQSNSITNFLSDNFYSGLNFPIGEKNLIDISYGYFSNAGTSNTNSDIQLVDSINTPLLNFKNNQHEQNKEYGNDFSIGLEHIFNENKEHYLQFLGSISNYKGNYTFVYDQQYQIPNNQRNVSDNLQIESTSYAQTQLDYVIAMNKTSLFESGIVGETIKDELINNYKNILTDFILNQSILGSYASYSYSREKWKAKGGLRIEHTDIKLNNTLKEIKEVDSSYLSLFPSGSIQFVQNIKKQTSLSYSKRIERPESYELNPNDQIEDPRNIYRGNVFLKPVFIHSLEWSINFKIPKKSITSTLYARLSENEISEVNRNRGDSIVVYELVNLNNRKSYGNELIYNLSPSKKLNINFTSNTYYTKINAKRAGFSKVESAISGNIKANTQLKFGTSNTFQVNMFYYFPEIYPQGRRKAMYYGNIAYKKGFINDNVLLNISLTDALYTFQYKSEILSNELDQYELQKRRFPVLFIGLIWKLNKYQAPDMMNYELENIGK